MIFGLVWVSALKDHEFTAIVVVDSVVVLNHLEHLVLVTVVI